MKRGEIWTVAGGGDYTGKPRPAVIVQADQFDETDSITVCPFTSDPTEAPSLRLVVLPDDENGLSQPSQLMVDKISTVRKSKFGAQVGRLSDDDLVRLNQALLVFLGFAGTPGS